MSHPIARRAGMLALTAAMLMPSAGALSDVSSWAQEGVAAAQNAGLAPSSLANSAASGSITRAEFCAVALNAYKAVSGKAVYVSGKKPFEDCSDPNVTAAYLLGIVKGRTNGNFDPDAKISREEMCTILDNILAAADIEATEIAGDACIEDYPDVSMISDYAMQPVVTMVDHSVINGITDTSTDTTILAPSGTTTREQALIMANRFCTAFKPDKTPIAAVDGSANLPTTAGSSASAATTITGLPQTEAEKMTYVYGAGNGKYQSAAEAEAHMVEIVVPVWHLQSDGTKVASKAYLQVNASLASIYQAIFEEIYNDPEQFPIHALGGARYTDSLRHAWGCAIDINPVENFYCNTTTSPYTAITGTTCFKYSDSPYCITPDSSVVKAFAKYGWGWGGGDADNNYSGWNTTADYMHFSILASGG